MKSSTYTTILCKTSVLQIIMIINKYTMKFKKKKNIYLPINVRIIEELTYATSIITKLAIIAKGIDFLGL